MNKYATGKRKLGPKVASRLASHLGVEEESLVTSRRRDETEYLVDAMAERLEVSRRGLRLRWIGLNRF